MFSLKKVQVKQCYDIYLYMCSVIVAWKHNCRKWYEVQLHPLKSNGAIRKILQLTAIFIILFFIIKWNRKYHLYHRWECLFVCLFDGVWRYFQQYFNYIVEVSFIVGGNRRTGENHRPLGFTTTYAISAYHHWCSEFEPRSGWGVQHHVIKFVSDLRQIAVNCRIFRIAPLHFKGCSCTSYHFLQLCFHATMTLHIYKYHWCSEFEPRSGWGVQHHVIKFVSDLRQVGGFLRFPPTIKLTSTI
jgi:hypothetical protein